MLETYQKKRDFRKTPEPPPQRGERKAKSKPLQFVVQKHDATRLHYDLRLELDGVLKSWAVPKGPSLNPKVQHLAVEVEDHPLSYATFEGTIPKGEYGGGAVLVWDRGTWEAIETDNPAKALRDGKLKFILHGEKLCGGWVLIRTSEPGSDKPQWLLKKLPDAEAKSSRKELTETRPESVVTGRTIEEVAAGASSADETKLGNLPKEKPAFVSPQLATLALKAPTGSGWFHEIKYDGYRLIAVKSGGQVRLYTRQEKDWTERFGGLAAEIGKVSEEDFVLDGEAVVFAKNGATNFSSLQDALSTKSKVKSVISFVAFDLLNWKGASLLKCTLAERKGVLKTLLEAAPKRIRYADHLDQPGSGPAMMEEACKLGLEGIICKPSDKPYHPGRRVDWLKVKCGRREEFVIGGYTSPQGTRAHFGALALGQWVDGEFQFRGKVGTGFTEKSLAELIRKFKPLETKTCPFAAKPIGSEWRSATWLKPDLVAEVRFGEITSDGKIRHGSFQGLREDKPARKVIPEVPVKTKPSSSSNTVAGVVISHPERVLYPELGLTKLELARYYEWAGPLMLEFLANRPLSLVRCPQGAGHTCFFQKHFETSVPAHVKTVKIPEDDGAQATYSYVVDVPGIVSLAQYGVIEFHPWGSLTTNIDLPDTLIFDLDPADDVTWEEVRAASFHLKEFLENLGLVPFVKTSGGKGLHLYVPIKPKFDWEVVKPFTKAIADALAKEDPKKYIATASKARRKGKIFIDYLRNGRGATCVTAFSARARAKAGISAPVTWDSLEAIRPDTVTLENAREYFPEGKAHAWTDYAKSAKSLTQAMIKKVGT